MEETRQKNYLTQRTGSEIHLALTMTHHRLTEHDTKIKPTFIANCWNFITVSCWSQEELLADWAMNTGRVMVYSHVWSLCSGVVMGWPGTKPCSTEAAVQSMRTVQRVEHRTKSRKKSFLQELGETDARLGVTLLGSIIRFICSIQW